MPTCWWKYATSWLASFNNAHKAYLCKLSPPLHVYFPLKWSTIEFYTRRVKFCVSVLLHFAKCFCTLLVYKHFNEHAINLVLTWKYNVRVGKVYKNKRWGVDLKQKKWLCIKVDWRGSNIVCHLVLEGVSTQCGEWERADKLMDGWRGCSISSLPQVLSHFMCFLVKSSTMDCLLSHD